MKTYNLSAKVSLFEHGGYSTLSLKVYRHFGPFYITVGSKILLSKNLVDPLFYGRCLDYLYGTPKQELIKMAKKLFIDKKTNKVQSASKKAELQRELLDAKFKFKVKL